MAFYNTRGIDHRSRRKDFDTMYNKGYAWNDLFDRLVKEALSKSSRLIVSNHLQELISNDYYGNRLFSPEDITIESLQKGDAVEVEFQLDYYGDDDINMLRKAVIRMPVRGDGEQVCAVVLFNIKKAPIVKTAWLNKSDDNHQSGLDMEDFDWRTDGEKFGYYYRGGNSKAFEIVEHKARELKSNKVTQ